MHLFLSISFDWQLQSIRILVYRNGDEFDPGTIVTVNRRQHRNWLQLLEDLSERCHLLEGSVNHIYSMDGMECRHFVDLDVSARLLVIEFVFLHYSAKSRGYFCD
jgi:hypothetical protein